MASALEDPLVHAGGGVPVLRPPRRPGGTFASLASDRIAVTALVILGVVVLFCFAGPLVYHSNQLQTSTVDVNLSPRAHHLLGTDPNGFDVLGRLMLGGRSALEIGFGAALLASGFGASFGAVAGYVGGVLDAVMMRVVDVLIAVPAIFVLIYLATILRPTTWVLIVVLGAMSWAAPARLVRAEALSLRTRDFVAAAKGDGAAAGWIIRRHVAPNVLDTVLVNATFQVADAIVVVAALSFLGFDLAPPAVSWGGMLSQGSSYLLDGYWWDVYPVLGLLVVTVFAFNLLGEGLRDALDVRLQSPARLPGRDAGRAGGAQ